MEQDRVRVIRTSETGQDQVLRIPTALEFSTGQIDGLKGVRKVLEIVDHYSGSKEEIIEAVRAEYFSQSASQRSEASEREIQQNTRAYNLILGMSMYGLFDRSNNTLTKLGTSLLNEQDDDSFASIFAEKIITACHGQAVINAIRNLQVRAVRINKTTLADELLRSGFHLPRATTNHLKLVGWLRTCGIVQGKYEIDEPAYANLIGSQLTDLEEWGSLTREQQAFLRSAKQLSSISSTSFIESSDIINLSTLQHGAVYKRPDQLNAEIYKPLEDMGWIERAPQTAGRGGKSPRIIATDKLINVDPDLLPDPAHSLPSNVINALQRPLEEIFADLKSTDTHKKGIALEALAGKLAISLGLTPVEFRLRGSRTGGAEVDLIAEGAHLQFSRWLFQCKNTPGHRTDLHDLAKEIGMAVLLKGHVVVMVSTGGFSSALQQYADELARSTALQTVLVDNEALEAFRIGGPSALIDRFTSQSKQTMLLKRDQIIDSSE